MRSPRQPKIHPRLKIRNKISLFDYKKILARKYKPNQLSPMYCAYCITVFCICIQIIYKYILFSMCVSFLSFNSTFSCSL